MTDTSHAEILERIHTALDAAGIVFQRFIPGEITAEYKAGHDPVTEADIAIDDVLRKHLLREGEGWLSEESVDDLTRLGKNRIWVIDPLDGTREFVAGIPEFCVSIAFVENGCPVAAGIYNPASKELFLGSRGSGVTYNGKPASASPRRQLAGAVVLASRSESKRGEWRGFQNATFQVRPVGSVAYKLALVSAGLADATFTLSPKHEWDVAAGAALVESAGGVVRTLDDTPLLCNQRSPLLSGLVACGANLYEEIRSLLSRSLSDDSISADSPHR
jgi:myo-inositol-1(or 4)-monophosphatase